MDSFGNVHSIAKSKFNGIGDELTNPESFTNAKYFTGFKWIS